MIKEFIEKIESLQPLPQTIMEIEEFRRNKEQNLEELLTIIEKDALLVSNLLKTANSALFGFRSKVETPKRLINLLGMKFTIYIAISETIQNILTSNLEPYEISNEEFMEASNLSSLLINLWLVDLDEELKEELILPALLQETGKFILAELIIEKNLTKQFIEEMSQHNSIATVEKKLLGISTSKATAKIFKHWGLSENLINMIEYIDDLENCPIEYKEKAQILNIIKTACNPKEILTEESVKKALAKSKSFNLDTTLLAKALGNLKMKSSK